MVTTRDIGNDDDIGTDDGNYDNDDADDGDDDADMKLQAVRGDIVPEQRQFSCAVLARETGAGFLSRERFSRRPLDKQHDGSRVTATHGKIHRFRQI